MSDQATKSILSATRLAQSGQVVVMPKDDLDAFTAFTADLVACLYPANGLEHQLAGFYASCQWRLNRLAAMEETLLTLGIVDNLTGNLQVDQPQAHNALNNAKFFLNEGAAFERISKLSQRLHTQAEKALTHLMHIQNERRRREQEQMSKAVCLYKTLAAEGRPFDPKEHGINLTLDQIKEYLAQQRTMHNPIDAVRPSAGYRKKPTEGWTDPHN